MIIRTNAQVIQYRLNYNFQNRMEKNTSLKDFEILSRLGEGAFGQVFKIKRKIDGQVYALKKIKTVSMSQKDKLNALNQVRILASYQGEHIIGYKQSFYDDVSGCLCIVLQFAQQGDVLRKINLASKANKRIQQSQIWKAMVHITKGIRSLHVNKVLHRDLKCANIFIMNDGTYKLGDLNISKVLKKQLAQTQTGTPYYCSPEVWKNKPYGIKSDMWSLGCVLYEMAALKPPFTANDLQGLFRKVCAGSFPRIPSCYSNQLSDIINSLLKQNPVLRPSTQELLNNPAVLKKFPHQIILQENQDFKLLQTIKMNQKNWKNLNLPKAKYIAEAKMEVIQENIFGQKLQKIRSYSMQRPTSTRSNKKSVQQIHKDKVKLNNYLDSSRTKQEKQKNEQLNRLKQQIRIIEKKRERVLSACGANRANRSIHESPRKNQPSKQEAPSTLKSSRKGSEQKLKLPPKPKIPNARDIVNNLLPPKPNSIKRDTSRKSLQRNQSKQNLKKQQQLLKVIQNEVKSYQAQEKTIKKRFMV